MFSLRDYIKKGFLDAVGKMSNYQIILNSAGWMEKGVLTEADLTDINAAIEAHEAAQVPVLEEETTEETETISEENETLLEETETISEENETPTEESTTTTE